MTFNIIKNVHDYHHDHDYDHYFDLDQYHDNDQIMNMTMTKKVIQNCVWYLFIKLPFSIWSYWKFILIYLQNFIYSSFSPKRIMILASNCFACISELRRRAGQRFSGSNFTFFRFSFSTDLVLLLGGCISQQKCRPEKRMIACYSAFLLPSQLHTFPCWVNRWVTATLEFWHKEWL